ncbi:MAG TPA: hypothetical protein VID03_03175 [Acidimicrobiia bacterium]|jgi:hypothetical protein
MEPRGVVVTGAYGTGKSSLIEEMASALEEGEYRFAAIDLDWLMWFQSDADFLGVYLQNLAAVVSNYLAAGVELFLLAGTVRDPSELEMMRAVLPFPLVAIRLTAPLSVIQERLSAAVTSGRADDLEVAVQQVQQQTGAGIEDLTLPNEGTIQEAAAAAMAWLGWLDQPAV